MSDLQKIVILCILGLVLVGVFFYALASIQENEANEIDDANEQKEEMETTTNTTSEEQRAEEQNSRTTSVPTSTEPTYEPGLPTSSDAGMEFPILE